MCLYMGRGGQRLMSGFFLCNSALIYLFIYLFTLDQVYHLTQELINRMEIWLVNLGSPFSVLDHCCTWARVASSVAVWI